jgi:hypothetical protein
VAALLAVTVAAGAALLLPRAAPQATGVVDVGEAPDEGAAAEGAAAEGTAAEGTADVAPVSGLPRPAAAAPSPVSGR